MWLEAIGSAGAMSEDGTAAKRARSPALTMMPEEATEEPDSKAVALGNAEISVVADRSGHVLANEKLQDPVLAAPDRFTGSMLGSGLGGILAADGGPLDARLRCFSAAMFYGKRVLHIGCGSGNTTIALAELFRPARILGIDKHGLKLRKARAALRARSTAATAAMHALTTETTSSAPEPMGAGGAAMTTAPLSARLQRPCGGLQPQRNLANSADACDPARAASSTATTTATSTAPTAVGAGTRLLPHAPRFPYNIGFRYEDAADDSLVARHGAGAYDVVLCFGATMEAHIRGGDDALDALIGRIALLLAPGGVLVLEPRTWRDYKRRQTRGSGGQSLAVRPARFPELLVRRHGFRHCAWLTPERLGREALTGVVEGDGSGPGYDGRGSFRALDSASAAAAGTGRGGAGTARLLSEPAESSRRRADPESERASSRFWGRQRAGFDGGGWGAASATAPGGHDKDAAWRPHSEATHVVPPESKVRRLLLAFL